MKKKLSVTIHSLFFVICAALAVSVLYHMVFTRHLNLKYTPAVLEESARELDNPYRGFYRMIGYILSDDRKPAEAAAWCSENCDSNPYPLMLLEINLKNYSNSNISTKARNQLDKILEQCLLAKKQVILRFLYDWDGQDMSTEPSDLSWIKKHISQLSSTVNKYSDCIYILQGTLTGNNGEMNNSNYGEINQIRQITLQSRLSLFNDGMLGSVYDLGTYDDTPLQSDSRLEEEGTRSEELLFQYKLCQYVPNGGEVTIDNKYNDLDNAITDLSQMHVSYLNSEHDAAVLNKWKTSTYTGPETDIFSGCTGYDYISTHLGYRYVMKESSVNFHSVLDDTATLYITIANTGFSSAYTRFDTVVILTNESTKESEKLETTIDNRTLSGNDFSKFKINLDIRSLKKGTYSVSLRMKDPYTKNSIHFANKGYEDSKTIPVGTLTLQ